MLEKIILSIIWNALLKLFFKIYKGLKMKKLLAITVAVVFLVGFTFAQNTATVTDNGSNNGSFIEQVGNPNTATINQTGDLNSADQADHFANPLFGLLTGAKGITQHGVGNTGTITQINGFTGTVLAGPTAGIGQFGNDNTSTITQLHNSAYDQEYAWVQQQTDHNMSTQKQVNNYSFSHIFQTGSTWNTAETQQWGGYGQKAAIYQNGYNNNAYQFQGQTSLSYTHSNDAEATQLGSSNKSKQYQYGSDNTAKTLQNGNSNNAETYQNTSENTSNVWQTGNSNNYINNQLGGNTNTVNLTQTDGSDANIYQNGADNTVMGLGVDIMGTSFKWQYPSGYSNR